MIEAKRDEVPLPEPVDELCGDDGFNVIGVQPVYTADQLREHGRQCAQAALESTAAELEAWRERFPAYVYRPQDDCVALRLKAAAAKNRKPKFKCDLAAEAARFLEREAAQRQAWIDQGKCPDCHGDGVIGGQFCGGTYETCETCKGSGKPPNSGEGGR